MNFISAGGKMVFTFFFRCCAYGLWKWRLSMGVEMKTEIEMRCLAEEKQASKQKSQWDLEKGY